MAYLTRSSPLDTLATSCLTVVTLVTDGQTDRQTDSTTTELDWYQQTAAHRVSVTWPSIC